MRVKRRRWLAGVGVAAAVAVTSAAVTYAGHSQPSASATDLLSRVQVVPNIPPQPGYQRGCGKGQACVFGQSWNDPADTSGCNTRERVLARDLHDVVTRPGPARARCKTHVIGGWLQDPYTNTRINFSMLNPNAIQIDHVYPEHRAWNAGANRWTSQRRVQFANDTDNLLAVSAHANESKGDAGIDTWLPANPAERCPYVMRYLTVAVKYGLSISGGDRSVAITTCPKESE